MPRSDIARVTIESTQLAISVFSELARLFASNALSPGKAERQELNSIIRNISQLVAEKQTLLDSLPSSHRGSSVDDTSFSYAYSSRTLTVPLTRFIRRLEATKADFLSRAPSIYTRLLRALEGKGVIFEAFSHQTGSLTIEELSRFRQDVEPVLRKEIQALEQLNRAIAVYSTGLKSSRGTQGL